MVRAYSIITSAATSSGTDPALLIDIACDASVIVTDAVILSAGIAIKAQANVFANTFVIGICESKSSSTLCTVRMYGLTDAIFSGLVTNSSYYLSDTTAGVVTATAPTASATVVLNLGKPFSSSRLIVNIGRRYQRA